MTAARLISFQPQTARELTAEPRGEQESGAFNLAASAATTAPASLAQALSIPIPSRIVAIQDLKSAQVRLLAPLFVNIEESIEGRFAAVSYDLELAGQGDSQFDSLDDLREQLVELFTSLSQMEADLPDHLHQKLSFLRSILQPCQ